MAELGASDTGELVWEHHTAQGVERGGPQPSGAPEGPLTAFVDVIAQAWRMRQSLWLVAVSDFKIRYRAQALGMFWSLAQPLVMMTTVAIAFVYILRIPIPNFTIFYLSAVIFWNFLSVGVISGTGALHSRVALVKHTNFPRPLMPIASVLSQIIGLGMESLLLLGFYFVFPDGYRFSAAWLVLPLLALLTLVLAVGVSLVTAPLSARYRDVDYVVHSIFMFGFWLSPILYSTSMAPPWLARWLRLNPAAGILEGARGIVMQGRFPDPISLVPAVTAAVIFFVLGSAFMRKANLTVADYL